MKDEKKMQSERIGVFILHPSIFILLTSSFILKRK